MIRDIKTCIDVDEDMVIKFIQFNYEPEEVFPKNVLERWAEDNGFIKKEDV